MGGDILVCIEGSPSSTTAVEIAIGLAHKLAADLCGVAIVDEPDIVAGEATSIGGASYKRQRDDALLADADATARAWLDDFVRRAQDAGVPARALELRGRPDERILEEMRKHELTVLGRHVNFRFETQDRDRKTRDRVLRQAGRPMMVVPETRVVGGPTILVAFDGSAAATRALQSFARSGLASGPVHVASVHDDGALAWEVAERGCALLSESGIVATPDNLVTAGSIADALLERRERLDAGLMVLGGYVPSALSRWVWGSVTHDLVERTVVPLFLHY